MNEPELTADRFLKAHSVGGNLAVYRTGDIAKLLPDGNILFLGRRDRLVKVRGYRVSLNEIEELIGLHPAVSEARVTLTHTATNHAHLIAYVVCSATLVSTSALRADLARSIPSYMIPASLVRLDRFPLLPNGKVDYEALSTIAAVPGQHKARPTNALQEQILKLWMTVLGNNDLGVDDDFFESGGDSLLAASLFLDIEQLTGQKLPLTTLFDAPTVRGVANVLSGARKQQAWPSLVPIKPAGDRPPLFCVHGVGGNVITYSSLAEHLSADRPLYGLQAQGLDQESLPPCDRSRRWRHTICRPSRRYSLRARIALAATPSEGGWLSRWHIS